MAPAASDTLRDRAGGGRVAMVTARLLDALGDAAGGATVLDCGGGSGAYAVPLARAGAQVTVVDISADALSTLHRRAAEAGVSGAVTGLAGEVEALDQLVDGQRYDAVLAHGVLDAVDRVGDTVAAMAARVRPGGVLSVLVANPVAGVLARALAGDTAAALDELRRLDPPSGAAPDAVAAAAQGAGLVLEARRGVGVFSDLVPGSVTGTAGAREALADLDAEAADRAPFADIAGRVHLLLRRPAG